MQHVKGAKSMEIQDFTSQKVQQKRDDLCTLGHCAIQVRLERKLMAHLTCATPFTVCHQAEQ